MKSNSLNKESLIASFVATVISQILGVIVMYNCLKGIYITNQYLGIILTIICLYIINTFRVELEYK